MEVAADNSRNTTYIMLSEVFDTLRLLSHSMNFLDENGDGWQVLTTLCSSVSMSYGEPKAKMALILWILRLLSFELKTFFLRERFADMLYWTLLYPELEEASNLLLSLGDAKTIDTALGDPGGYTILHRYPTFTTAENVSEVLINSADLHPLGFDPRFTPQKESPTSLAMYSSWAFADCQYVLNESNLEEFIDQELERNALVHPGWVKETLHKLFAYRSRPDLNFREVRSCSDCSKDINRVKVQPCWRHLLERIKQGMDPDNPILIDSRMGGSESADITSINEDASGSSSLAHKPDITGNVPIVDVHKLSSKSDSRLESEVVLKDDVHGHPATIPVQSDCVYAPHEVICVDCWLHYRHTGTRRSPRPWKRHFARDDGDETSLDKCFSSGDESSEDDFSPYLIHS